MISLSQAIDAVMNCDELHAELAQLRREVATLRAELSEETLRANAATDKAKFYYALSIDLAKLVNNG